jgi:hypothetical protein
VTTEEKWLRSLTSEELSRELADCRAQVKACSAPHDYRHREEWGRAAVATRQELRRRGIRAEDER